MLPHLLSDRASLTHCAGAHAASLFVQSGCRAAGPSLEAAVPHVRQCLAVHLAPLSLLSYEEAAGAVLSAEVYSALRATRFSEDGDCEPPPPTWQVAETLEGLRDEDGGDGAARTQFWQAVADSLLRSLSRRLFRRERKALGIDGGSGGDVPRDVLALPARDWEVLTAPLCDCHGAAAAAAAALAPPSVPELLARLDAQGCVSAVRADGVTLADASGDGLHVLRGVRRARGVHLVRLSNEGLLALLGEDRRCRQGSVLSLWPAAAETLAVSHCKRLNYLPLARLLQALLCAGCCAADASPTREANDASWRNASRELLAALGAGVGGASAERRRRLDGGYAECCAEEAAAAAPPAELAPALPQHPRRCLRSLSLCSVVLDNAALVHVVAASLRRCRTLTSLELSHNHSPVAYLYGAAEARAERAADEACAAGEAGSGAAGGAADDGLPALFGHRNTTALSSRAVRDRVFGRPPRAGASLPSSLSATASQKPQQRVAMQKNPFPEMAVVGRALAACQASGLTALAVTYNFVTVDFFEGFGRGVLPALTTLDLKGNEIFLDGRCPSGQLRGGGEDISPPFLLQSLTQLNLSHNPLYYREEEDGSDEAVADTGRLGSFFSSFASSILRGNQGVIVRKFLKLPFSLVELDVSSSHVGLDVVVDAIVSPLPAALSTAVVPLRCLRANFCRYARVPTPGGDDTGGGSGGDEDDSSSWISRLLRQTSATLQTLSLASCCLKERDADAFAQNLQHATALRHLSLGGNNTGLCVRLLTAPRGGLPAHSLDTLCLLNLLVSEEDLRAAPERRSGGLVRRVEVGPEACLPHHYADFLAPMLSPEEGGADAAVPATDVVELGGGAGGASGANEFDIDA